MSMATQDHDSPPVNRYKNAARRPDFTIEQDWASYSAAEHDRWDRLFARSQAILRERACDEFLAALHTLELSKAGIPDMAKLSDRLEVRQVASEKAIRKPKAAPLAPPKVEPAPPAPPPPEAPVPTRLLPFDALKAAP